MSALWLSLSICSSTFFVHCYLWMLSSLLYISFQTNTILSRGRKSLKNQTRDVIKMREMRREVGKKPLKKDEYSLLFMTSRGWFLSDFLLLQFKNCIKLENSWIGNMMKKTVSCVTYKIQHQLFCLFVCSSFKIYKVMLFGVTLCSCLKCPNKMGIDVTAVGLPIILLLTLRNTIYHISFLGGFFPPSQSLSLQYDVNRIGRPKAMTSIPIFAGY